MSSNTRTPGLRSLLFAYRGTIMPVIWRRVLYTVFLSLIVAVLDLRYGWFGTGLNATPLTLLGLTLAIFLGFRNQVAYQRWWEARVLWGELITIARDIARQVRAFLPGADATERATLMGMLIAFAHALRHHLRGTDPTADVSRWLSPRLAEETLAAPNRPAYLVHRLGIDLADAARTERTDPILLAQIDLKLSQLSHVLAGCERISGTPIPFSYILLLHRSVHVYCFFLPFCLVGVMGWFTPVVVAILAYTFFGLDALGDQIEDPFDVMPNDLPLDRYSTTVENDLLFFVRPE
ncbi:bestrophin family protein [Luteibacter aegosomaticola]|uniref:bestrophin family protein n=1 Tax=Luteibacter aegosomaticola TaxID=2911538 RepID=UPI001FF96E2C|nr:bestrophin family protein [Luteibacter aegosomaticola]UPG87998.1 bestrophin family protein [Luteibacter aegosomaticola]